MCAFIGFKPFVEACIDADEKSEAVKYISKLADPREKAEVFLYFEHIVKPFDLLAYDPFNQFFTFTNKVYMWNTNRRMHE